MELKLTGHTFEYELTQAANLFYRADADVVIYSELLCDGNAVKTQIQDGEECADAVFEFEKTADVRTLKNAVKKSLFLCAKKLYPDTSTPWGIMTGIRPCKPTRELIREYGERSADKILKDEYWVSDKKRELCLEICKNQEPVFKMNKEGDAGLYIGIPFCPTRCLYCSFISESAGRYQKLLPEYVDSLTRELTMIAQAVKETGMNIRTIYIGGGTPTTLSDDLLKKLTDAVGNLFDTKALLEYTVEAGRPDTVTREKMDILRTANVSRLCINPQTMNDDTLKRIGRSHTEKDVYDAFRIAKEAGFANINSDLICGLPGETEGDFLNTLDKIKELSPTAVTVHTMYLKRASQLFKQLSAHTFSNRVDKMLLAMQEFAKKEGFSPYYLYRQRGTLSNLENVGYAKNDAISYYNVFMMEEVQTIFAAGSGASTKMVRHGHIERIYNNKDPKWYIDSLDEMLPNKKKRLLDYFAEGQI